MVKGKRVTVPNQCMSLEEMLRRFVRREALPVEKQGVYVESEYDLEKLAKEDRVHQEEVLAEMKRDTESKKKKVEEAKAKKAAEKKEAEDKAKADYIASLQQMDPLKTSPPKA